MAEIKSTLDIIMEKTKGMTMTEAERAQLRREEWAGKIKGWVQKYLDNLINLETLRSELKKEGKERYFELQKILKREILNRIEPDTDNSDLFKVLEDVLDIRRESPERAINRFQEEVALERASKLESLKSRLSQMGISGSAVIPNLNNNTQWNRYYQERKNDFRKEVMCQ
jgi:hypothetical protein